MTPNNGEAVVATRFSFLGRSGWKSDASRESDLLFAPERLKTRLRLFEQIAVASLAGQTDQNFHHYILTSKDLPQWAMEHLQRICASAYPEGAFTIDARASENARKSFRRFLSARYSHDPVLQIVLDDDDGLACDFMQDMRYQIAKAAQLPKSEPARKDDDPVFLSYSSGYGLVFQPDAGPQLFHHMYPYINLGLTMLAPRRGQNLFSINHRAAPRRFGALLVKEKPMFIRSVHGFNDSRVAVNTRWRKIDDWPTDAQIATRFPFLLQVSA